MFQREHFKRSRQLKGAIMTYCSYSRESSRYYKAISVFGFLALLLIGLTGCKTPTQPSFTELEKQAQQAQSEVLVLHEGDAVRVTFPGATTLNTVQQIRRDGRITLPMIGEFKAVGLTPTEMEKELIKLYESQLQTKEIYVAVESSAFPVYVTGAVLRPGKIMSDRPINALQAIMEAGGFDYTKADLKSVKVIRHEGGQAKHYTINLKKVVQGSDPETFSLKPADIIYVPERFVWF
jgi:polysaccharide export outer membrane protein